MSLWIPVGLLIVAAALLGTLGVLLTGRTWIAFLAAFNLFGVVTALYVFAHPPLDARKALVLGMAGLYLLPMNGLLLLAARHTALPKVDAHVPRLQKLALPWVLSLAAGGIYPLPFFFAARRSGPLTGLDLAAVAVYGVGTVLHVGADLQKAAFRRRGGQGLLDRGPWGLCRHPNYLGDFLTYVAFALIGGHPVGWLSPLLNLLQYVFDAIPRGEAWMAARHGEAWAAYCRRVPWRLIPYVW